MVVPKIKRDLFSGRLLPGEPKNRQKGEKKQKKAKKAEFGEKCVFFTFFGEFPPVPIDINPPKAYILINLVGIITY
jgi:hypothetical protein